MVLKDDERATKSVEFMKNSGSVIEVPVDLEVLNLKHEFNEAAQLSALVLLTLLLSSTIMPMMVLISQLLAH